MSVDELQQIKNIVVLMAMQQEANPIINSLSLIENQTVLSPQLPFKCFQTNFAKSHLTIITSGIDHKNQVDNIGCEAATLMAYESIKQLNPDIIISAGTAGGFSDKGAVIGSIYASENYFIFHDRIVPLPGFRESAIGHFPAHNVNKMASDLLIKTGIMSTGSSLEKNLKEHFILDEHEVVAKEMEAAAIAWVAMLHNIPMFAIKSITNLVDQQNQSEKEFIKNFDYSVKCLHDKLLEVIDYLQGRNLEEL
jgi:nucleoside phosphorylase